MPRSICVKKQYVIYQNDVNGNVDYVTVFV